MEHYQAGFKPLNFIRSRTGIMVNVGRVTIQCEAGLRFNVEYQGLIHELETLDTRMTSQGMTPTGRPEDVTQQKG